MLKILKNALAISTVALLCMLQPFYVYGDALITGSAERASASVSTTINGDGAIQSVSCSRDVYIDGQFFRHISKSQANATYCGVSAAITYAELCQYSDGSQAEVKIIGYHQGYDYGVAIEGNNSLAIRTFDTY